MNKILFASLMTLSLINGTAEAAVVSNKVINCELKVKTGLGSTNIYKVEVNSINTSSKDQGILKLSLFQPDLFTQYSTVLGTFEGNLQQEILTAVGSSLSTGRQFQMSSNLKNRTLTLERVGHLEKIEFTNCSVKFQNGFPLE